MQAAGHEEPQGRCVIIGAGPAGLTAAWELRKAEVPVVVFEKDRMVGGISRTESYKGYRYDIGGHRFFTKVEIVEKWWIDILKGEFLTRPRLSRIYYNDRFFDYPLKPINALTNLGIFEAIRCLASFAVAQVWPSRDEKTLDRWVSNRFGTRLYQIFFKTYTEKVWGMPCSEISADWAAQRIKNLNLLKAVTNALVGESKKGEVVTTLIESFQYPRLGPGQLWEKVAQNVTESGGTLQLNTGVKAIHHDGTRAVAVTVVDDAGKESRVEGAHFISSMPVRELVNCLDPKPPAAVLEAADRLRYRDFLTVGLVIDHPEVFPDNWIYIHSPAVKVGRIQNFKSWSPHMLPDQSKSSVGLEYFVQENDDVWGASDEELVALATREVEALGLVPKNRVVDGCVIRIPKAYPVYDDIYQDCLKTIREYLDTLPNLQLVGRNGQHRYNNQDHSMVTAMYAARNVLGDKLDVWAVNVEAEYHEEVRKDAAVVSNKGGDPLVPARVDADPRQAIVEDAFGRYHPVALGVAFGSTLGASLFLATVVLVLRGGAVVGPNFSLLNNYFIGYSVTWPGAVVGLLEGAAIGFGGGYILARVINAVVGWHERVLVRKLELHAALDTAAGDSP